MNDRVSVTSAEFLPHNPNSNLLADCGQQFVYSAVQKPVSGVAQLIDSLTGTDLEKRSRWIEEPGQAPFGSGRWHLEQLACGVGAVVPFVVAAKMTRPLTRSVFEHGVLPISRAPAGQLLQRYAMAEAAFSGFASNALFEPSDGSEPLLKQRLKRGAVGALTLGLTNGGSQLLGRLTGACALEAGLFNKALTTGIAGGGAGVLGGTADALLSGRPLDVKQLATSGYSMAFTGATMSLAAGNFMKLNLGRSTTPAVDEFVARNYDGSSSVPHYQRWLANQSLSGQARALLGSASDAVRSRVDSLIEQVGLRRPVNEPVTLPGDTKSGEQPKAQYRDARGTLNQMTPSDRLMFVRKLAQLGTNPLLTESSLNELFDRLDRANSVLPDRQLQSLYEAREQASLRLKESRELAQKQKMEKAEYLDSPSTRVGTNYEQRGLEFTAANKAFSEQMMVRQQDLADALNPWLARHKMPPLVFERGLPGGTAEYGFGLGKIALSDVTLIGSLIEADLYAHIFHEVVHARQDVLRIRRIADQMGIGPNATTEQVIELNRRQAAAITRHGSIEDGLPQCLSFTERVLNARKGVPLTAAEAREAAVIETRVSEPEPPWAAQANLISRQKLNVSKARENVYKIGELLTRLKTDPEWVKNEFGFRKIPQRLIELSDGYPVPDLSHVTLFQPPEPSTLAGTRMQLQAQEAVLKMRLKPYSKKEYNHYMNGVEERQAYPAGLLAFLFARQRLAQ